jgi:mono/diheme cytochrome c family protein
MMIGHYGRFVEVQTSLAMGDLQSAQAAAHSLGNSQMPPTMTEWVEVLQSAAEGVAGASNIDEAAQASGTLILACGSCHADLGVSPNVRLSGGAPTGDSRAEHMVRDMWALDQLLDGMVSGDHEYWMNGARTLAEDNNMGDLGRQAMAATGDQRAVVYGRVISGCADCHTR